MPDKRNPRGRATAGASKRSDRATADTFTVAHRLARLQPLDRRRIIARLDELEHLARLARRAGTLAEVVEAR